MEISKERIEEFKQIYKRQFGEEISDERAYELALPILQILKVICQPLPEAHRRTPSPPEKEGTFDKSEG